MDATSPSAAGGAAQKAGYKSWKKKYRKMRIACEEKMTESGFLYRQEEHAQALIKRLALENE